MEIKVGCACGQNYKFDVEPVNARMPVKVGCPSCGADGTASANLFLAQQFPNQKPPVAVAMRVQPGPVATVAAPPMASEAVATAPPPAIRMAASKKKQSGEFNLGLGVLGAVLGAAVGAGLMYGFYMWASFRFPMMGTCIGALAGLGARTLAKGTDSTLGVIAGAIALVATAGTLYLMFGQIAAMFILSMIVSVSFAYRIAG